MTVPLLEIDNLRLGLRTGSGLARILDGVNLRMAPGEVMGLVGESGCGKTTLARAILGVLPEGIVQVESGRIAFRGQDLLRADPAEVNENIRGRAVTFVPQDPFSSLNPLFSIGAQIDDLMRWKSPRRDRRESRYRWLPERRSTARRRADQEAVIATLEAVQLPQPAQLLAKYPHEVSGGQRQRLMIAMALLPEPDLIIADEPTTALDVTIQAQILGLLRRLATERGVAVLLTTHDLGSAYEICDSVTVMYAGQEVETAPIDRFFRSPAHPYTGMLLASLPREDGDVAGIPGEVPSPLRAPGGCRFNPRCVRATDVCITVRPQPESAGIGHLVRCHHKLEGVPA